MRKEPRKPHIKLWHGTWYAFGGGGGKKTRNLGLVAPINFCKRLNEKRAKTTGSAT